MSKDRVARIGVDVGIARRCRFYGVSVQGLGHRQRDLTPLRLGTIVRREFLDSEGPLSHPPLLLPGQGCGPVLGRISPGSAGAALGPDAIERCAKEGVVIVDNAGAVEAAKDDGKVINDHHRVAAALQRVGALPVEPTPRAALRVTERPINPRVRQDRGGPGPEGPVLTAHDDEGGRGTAAGDGGRVRSARGRPRAVAGQGRLVGPFPGSGGAAGAVQRPELLACPQFGGPPEDKHVLRVRSRLPKHGRVVSPGVRPSLAGVGLALKLALRLALKLAGGLACGALVPPPCLEVEAPRVPEELAPVPPTVHDGEVAPRRVDQGRVAPGRRPAVHGRAVGPATGLEVEQLGVSKRRRAVQIPPAEHEEMRPARNGRVV
mmetsp:Transcript_35579/g.80248  ORF Transcript_35579/g.80248 Transcript_35579/m.80248 type:complete len:376 (+) Transcript_35579:424-1551(+)